MQPFEITTETNITNLPIKKRFQLMQKWAEDSGRTKLFIAIVKN